MQRDQRGRPQPFGIGLAEIRHPVIPGPAQIVGVLRLQAVVAMQRKGAEQNRHIQTFLVHRRQLGHRVVVAPERLRITMRHRILAGHDLAGNRLWRRAGQCLNARSAQRLAVGERELDLTVLLARLSARNALAPPRVHVLQVEIMRFEDMHVAVENLKIVSGHRLALGQNSLAE